MSPSRSIGNRESGVGSRAARALHKFITSPRFLRIRAAATASFHFIWLGICKLLMKVQALAQEWQERRSSTRNNISEQRSSSGGGGGGGRSGARSPRSASRKSRQSQSLFTNPRFLRIGLATTVSFHFSWVAMQLSTLTTQNAAYDGLLIAPEYNKDGKDLYSWTASGGSGVEQRTFSNPFDPREIVLPVHPSPNRELQHLVSSHAKHDCPEGLYFVEDHIRPDNVTHPPGRKIPNLMHITAKSRCMTRPFAFNVLRWKRALGEKYSIYIHDDDAVNKFIYEKRWIEFPELKEVMSCVTAGAAKADIWRYIMIWEYGGIYGDFDTSPNKFNADSIADEDDAFFPIEMLGIPSQYWFAAAPRHPVMYLSAKQALQTMAFRPDISNNAAHKTTGPGSFKTGIILFLQICGQASNAYVTEGLYTGANERTVRVVGSQAMSNEWIIREGVKAKGFNYEQMGMTTFHGARAKFNEIHQYDHRLGCMDQRYKMHIDNSLLWVNIV